MSQRHRDRGGGPERPGERDLKVIITDPEGTKDLVAWADRLGRRLKNQGLATNQIRALFGEVRQIEAEWGMEGRRDRARHRLILLKPKMAYRARRERGRAVEELVNVLDPALDLVVNAPDQEQGGNFRRFVEFFEAILAYHKAYGGS